jgi:hypothetical protein
MFQASRIFLERLSIVSVGYFFRNTGKLCARKRKNGLIYGFLEELFVSVFFSFYFGNFLLSFFFPMKLNVKIKKGWIKKQQAKTSEKIKQINGARNQKRKQ